ncbi:hypothetical protein SCHPADRAFT_228917 [Schizopora paradoxa]|uniref:EGF-like domain-containing protein n=1 Tax=Schizopora paradoxa TaxID=27342 RepID=A0A0H2SGB9_9AGAM|nr:hypothetical protein SCHPADRAFT_228917 [Schizopora paradoxa]
MAKHPLRIYHLSHILLLLLFTFTQGIHTVKATDCLNGGYLDASNNCNCPSGFGGTTCTLPQCGGNAFSNPRPLQNASASVEPGAGGGSIIARSEGLGAKIISLPAVPAAESRFLSGRSLALDMLEMRDSSNNSSDDTCACDAGWTGLGCGVCASSTSCNTAFLASGGFYPSGGSVSDGGSNNVTLTCNTGPVVVNAGLMSCKVENASYTTPTSPALAIHSSLGITLLRRPNSIYSPVSGLRVPPAYASSASPLSLQLWLGGVEQVSCAASACEVVDDRQDEAGDEYEYDSAMGDEDVVNATTAANANGTTANATASAWGSANMTSANTSKGKVRLSTRWECSDLTCSCIPGTKFCGESEGALNLTAQVASISGGLTLTCPPTFNSSSNSSSSPSPILTNTTTSNSSSSSDSCALTSLSPAFRALFNITHAAHSPSLPYTSTSDIPPILLTSCSFGECIAQNAFDASGFNPASSGSARTSGIVTITTVLVFSVVGAVFSW